MYVYVLSADGKPLMPTQRFGKVRRMLRDGKAKVVKKEPFTIQLLYETTKYVQPVTLGVDAGSKTIGLSASTEKREYFSAEVEVRNDISELMSTRRESRRTRRSRKTRYRAPRFNNRTRPKGWLPPSVKAKTECHIQVVKKVCSILPISRINIELAAFDMQKLKADLAGLERPQSEDYQHGEQFGFWNVREYVLCRDNHTCQHCKGKSKDKILNVHHIQSRKTGGDAPNNLVTLCETCHKRYHAGEIKLSSSIKHGAVFKDAVFMGIMRWACYDILKKIFRGKIHMAFGYKTKSTRISAGLPKAHCIDALCIAEHSNAERCDTLYHMKKVRRHNRKIYKDTIFKGGVKHNNQASHIVKGFRLFDCVEAKGLQYYVHGRRSNGSFVLKTLSGLSLEIAPSKIKFIRAQHGMIIEKSKTPFTPAQA